MRKWWWCQQEVRRLTAGSGGKVEVSLYGIVGSTYWWSQLYVQLKDGCNAQVGTGSKWCACLCLLVFFFGWGLRDTDNIEKSVGVDSYLPWRTPHTFSVCVCVCTFVSVYVHLSMLGRKCVLVQKAAGQRSCLVYSLAQHFLHIYTAAVWPPEGLFFAPHPLFPSSSFSFTFSQLCTLSLCCFWHYSERSGPVVE